MTPKVKSSILLISTLIIGMLLGALVNARVAEQRVQQIESLRSQRGFVQYLERGIKPVDDQQRAEIRTVLQRTQERMGLHMRQSRQEVRAILDSMRTELDTVLTDEQMRRLERHLQQRSRGPRLQGRPPGRMDGRQRPGLQR